MSFLPTFLEGEAVSAGVSAIQNYVTLIPQGMLGAISIAATIEEDHSSELQITEHPVETGAAVTDHSYVRPAELTMKCAWSNSSPDALSQLVVGAVSSLINSGGSSLFADGTGPNADYVSGIFSQILALQASRQPFTAVTTLKSYPNMLIRSIRVPRDHTNSQALLATVSMRQILLVSTSSSTLSPPSSQANPASTQDITNLGPVALVPNATPSPGGSYTIPTSLPLTILPGGPS